MVFKMYKSAFFFSLLYVLCSTAICWSATYYVDATNGNDSNPGTSSPSTAWKTIAKVNNSSFQPGDFILFKRGEIWREQLYVPSSGTSKDPIMYGAYGSGDKPVISGADILTGFIIVGGSTYSKSNIIKELNSVFYNGKLLNEKDSATLSIGYNEWDWDSDTLYINVGENPSGGTVEAAKRNYGIYINGKNYVTVDGLAVKYANDANIQGSGVNDTIQNCDISYAANKGIIWATTSGNVVIANNAIYDNGHDASDAYGCGIFTWKDAGSSGNENYIRNNTIYNNQDYGVHLISNYWIIEYNKVYDNGNTTNMTSGIELIDWDDDGYSEYNIVRYNEVWGQLSGLNDGSGILIDNDSAYCSAYYNIIHDNDGPGVGSWRASNTSIFNNTTYNNGQDSSGTHTDHAEIFIGSNASTPVISNIVVKNNVSYATGINKAIVLDGYAIAASGLDISSNNWYSDAGNFYRWDVIAGNNLATWNAYTGVGTDINSDPLMTDPAKGNFSIKGASPCRDAGTDVGLRQDYEGKSIIGIPDIGAYEYQGPAKPTGLRISAYPQNFSNPVKK